MIIVIMVQIVIIVLTFNTHVQDLFLSQWLTWGRPSGEYCSVLFANPTAPDNYRLRLCPPFWHDIAGGEHNLPGFAHPKTATQVSILASKETRQCSIADRELDVPCNAEHGYHAMILCYRV